MTISEQFLSSLLKKSNTFLLPLTFSLRVFEAKARLITIELYAAAIDQEYIMTSKIMRYGKLLTVSHLLAFLAC
jgi:hypothetical protein